MNDLKEIGGFIVSADPYVNHDNSLSGNGTLTSPLGVVPGYNETVLWSGNAAALSATLSEPVSNFQRFRIKTVSDELFEFDGTDNKNHTIQFGNSNTVYLYFKLVNFQTSGTALTTNRNQILNYGQWNASSPSGFYYDKTSEPNWLKEVWGINRKQ